MPETLYRCIMSILQDQVRHCHKLLQDCLQELKEHNSNLVEGVEEELQQPVKCPHVIRKGICIWCKEVCNGEA